MGIRISEFFLCKNATVTHFGSRLVDSGIRKSGEMLYTRACYIDTEGTVMRTMTPFKPVLHDKGRATTTNNLQFTLLYYL